MSIQYTWKVNQLERDPATGAVKTAHWDCLGVDEDTGNSVHMYGSNSLPPADPNNPDFIEFDALTEEQVLGWIWQGPTKEERESSIAQQIDMKNNPPVVPGLPW